MSGCKTDTVLKEQKTARVSTTTNRLMASIGRGGSICSHFIELLREEQQICDACQFNHDRNACNNTHCMADVKPCEDYECPKNFFYVGVVKNWKTIPTWLSLIARNCTHGIQFTGKATLEELAEMYGITRERVRQVEEGALISFGKKFNKNKELAHWVREGGQEHFKHTLLDKRHDLRQRHYELVQQKKPRSHLWKTQNEHL